MFKLIYLFEPRKIELQVSDVQLLNLVNLSVKIKSFQSKRFWHFGPVLKTWTSRFKHEILREHWKTWFWISMSKFWTSRLVLRCPTFEHWSWEFPIQNFWKQRIESFEIMDIDGQTDFVVLSLMLRVNPRNSQ